MWHLPDDLRAQIEAALGEPWPDDASARTAVLTRLRVEDPDLYRAVIAELSGSPVALTVEVENRRRMRRERLEDLILGWARKRSQTGEIIVHRRRLHVVLLLAGGVALLALMGLSLVARPPQPTVPASIAPASAPPLSSGSRAPGPGSPGAGASRPRTPEATSDRGTPLPPDAGAPASPATALPRPPLPPFPPAPIMTPAPRPSRPAEAGDPDIPELPDADDAPPGTAQPGDRPAARDGAAQVVVFSAQGTASSSTPMPFNTPGRASETGPVVYEPDRTLSASATQAARSPGADPPNPTTPPPAPPAGARLSGRLLTGISLVPNLTVPVAAGSGTPEAVWLGEASVDAAGLLRVVFTRVVVDQRERQVHAIALDHGAQRPGLAAATVMRTPDAAAAAVRVGMEAASDYLRLLSQQRQVTITNGWATINAGEPPPLWAVAAGRLAGLMAQWQASDRPVPVTEVRAGTPITILILQGGP
ncbi:MAG: hypothetical protein HY660_02095 [Armatimonadetes bacterium]|nr:hypothetical protein [Armatimonadota bacterium]